ncbi:STAS domain-containing protein [Nannocystis pusilla]|uniref:STAS domain-containing protein n=1 Tax=Nannocystis pusilla TaxID=889268 RepID=UPI003DA35EAE
MHATGRPYYEDGKLTRIYGAFRNITDIKQRENDLREKLARIAQQDEAIRVLSTPIIQLWDDIITLPVVGALDPERATQIMDRLLHEVSKLGARFAILDLTGVDAIDTTTADQILRITRAVSLLGARSLLCGVQPGIAQTLTELGVEMAGLHVYRNLQEALRGCLGSLSRSSGR